MTSRTVLAATFGLSALVFGALAWGASYGNVAHALTNCATGSAGLSSSEVEMIVLMNGARAQNGAGPLLASPALNQAAAWMAEDFDALKPSHTDSLGRPPNTRVRDCGYPSGAGENIAWGYSSASSAFNGWMNSSGHRANILNGTYQVIGVGFANGAWVANFGSVVDAGAFEVTGGSPPPSVQPTSTPTQPPATNAPSNNPPPGGGGGLGSPTATPTAVPTYWNPNNNVIPQGAIVPRIRVPMLARQ